MAVCVDSVVAVLDGVNIGVPVGVCVVVRVADGVDGLVALAVAVRVGDDVAPGADVAVGEGTGPTSITNWLTALTCPPVSRRRTLTRVSPA